MSLKEQSLNEKLRSGEMTLSREAGPLTLFGLFEQEDKPGKWDLIASASWLKSNRASIQRIVDALQPYFQTAEWGVIRQVVPLHTDEPFVQAMLRALRPAEHEVCEIGPLFTADYRIGRAVIITVNPAAVSQGQGREVALSL